MAGFPHAGPMKGDDRGAFQQVRRELETDMRVSGMTAERGRLVVYTEDEELLAAKDPAAELGVDVPVVVRRGGPVTPAS